MARGFLLALATRAAFASSLLGVACRAMRLDGRTIDHRERQGIAAHCALLSQKLSATNQALLISLNHEAMLVSIGYRPYSLSSRA